MRLVTPIYQALGCTIRGDHLTSKLYLTSFDPIDSMDVDRGSEVDSAGKVVTRRAMVTGGESPRMIRLPEGAKIVIHERPSDAFSIGLDGIKIVTVDSAKRVKLGTADEALLWIDAATAIQFAIGRKRGFELLEPRHTPAVPPGPLPAAGVVNIRDGAMRPAGNPVALYAALMTIVDKEGNRKGTTTVSFEPIAAADFESITGHRLIQEPATEPSHYVAVADGATIGGVGEEAYIDLTPGQGGAWISAKTLSLYARERKYGLEIIPAEWKHTLKFSAVARAAITEIAELLTPVFIAALDEFEKPQRRGRPKPPGQDSFQWGRA